MTILKLDCLDFFNDEYKWPFRDYINATFLSMTLEEVIDNEIEMIELNGSDRYFKFPFRN